MYTMLIYANSLRYELFHRLAIWFQEHVLLTALSLTEPAKNKPRVAPRTPRTARGGSRLGPGLLIITIIVLTNRDTEKVRNCSC